MLSEKVNAAFAAIGHAITVRPTPGVPMSTHRVPGRSPR